MNPPPLHGEWLALAAIAAHLLATRIAADPAQVAAGGLTQAEAADRARTGRSLEALWRAIVDHADIPPLEAGHAELRADLDRAARIAGERARSHPNTTLRVAGLIDPLPYPLFAELVAALSWHHRPCSTGCATPWIVLLHETNQELRARARAAVAERSGKAREEGGQRDADRSAERAARAAARGGSTAPVSMGLFA